MFNDIWKEYPNKIGKTKAKKYFLKAIKTTRDFERMQRALKNYKAHLKANNWKQPQDGKTWFNPDNWQDWADALPHVRKTEALTPRSDFERTVALCEEKLAGKITKEAIAGVLGSIPDKCWKYVEAWLGKKGDDFGKMYKDIVSDRSKVLELVK